MSLNLVLVAMGSAVCGAAIAAAVGAHRTVELREYLIAARAAARTDDQMLEAFAAASGRALHEQSEQFVRIAESRYSALEHSAEAQWRSQGAIVFNKLDEFAKGLQSLEDQRRDDSVVVRQSVEALKTSSELVRSEAAQLAGALKNSSARGAWGEVQLRRVLELSGMQPHIDFDEQRGITSADSSGRPDVVVKLPGSRSVVIDAKVPLDRYLEAQNATDPAERLDLMAQHAAAVTGHVHALSKRDYSTLVDGAVDLVVMFLPGDGILAAASEADPHLLERAFQRNIILASPSILLGYLRSVALGWREHQVAEEADQIAELGRELHDRVGKMAEHFSQVGESLGKAVTAYNSSIGSIEARMLVTTRKFEDLGAGSPRKIPVTRPVDVLPHRFTAPELTDGSEAGVRSA